jgi:hypothetical protein
MTRAWRRLGAVPCVVAMAAVSVSGLSAALAQSEDPAERLIAAYPDQLTRVEAGAIVWKDGTRMPLDDGRGEKSFEEWLADPDLADMFRFPYPTGSEVTPPAFEWDPGRARNAAFFDKMYGDCRQDQVRPGLVDVVWLPHKRGERIAFSSVNGAAARLEAVSRELDALPSEFDSFLHPVAGTYICRPIAGTSRISAHGHGIAIDIAVKQSHYWRWSKPGPGGRYAYANRIPVEIVRIFEKHGFIWGGRWYHYDTMHFEYRPELAPPVPLAAP